MSDLFRLQSLNFYFNPKGRNKPFRPFETLVYIQQPNRSQSDNCKFISGEVCHHMYKHVCLKLYTIGVETEEENIDKYEKYMYNRC